MNVDYAKDFKKSVLKFYSKMLDSVRRVVAEIREPKALKTSPTARCLSAFAMSIASAQATIVHSLLSISSVLLKPYDPSNLWIFPQCQYSQCLKQYTQGEYAQHYCDRRFKVKSFNHHRSRNDKHKTIQPIEGQTIFADKFIAALHFSIISTFQAAGPVKDFLPNLKPLSFLSTS